MIYSLTSYMRSLVAWDFLRDCFMGTRIAVSDLDGIVERNGHFLYLEGKSPGKAVPMGQQITFNALAKNPQNTILVVWGENIERETCPACGLPQRIGDPEIKDMVVWGRDGNVPHHADLAEVKRFVASWFAFVSSARK